MNFIKKVVDFFWDLKDALEIVKNRSKNIESVYFGTPERAEALDHYRKLWPKTPCGCCEDAHEAGWVQGYQYSKELFEQIEAPR